MKPKTYYVICTSPRSGSWMLCSCLWQTRVAGIPTEFFGPTLGEEFRGNNRFLKVDDIHELMDALVSASTTSNGVFGLKLLSNQTNVFVRRASEHKKIAFDSLRKALEAEFPNVQYIFLKRENKVAQAISLYRATMTNAWRITSNDAPRPARELPYDQFAIQRCYQDSVAGDVYWEGFFRTHAISPFRLTYEELTQDHTTTVRGILQYLGLPTDMIIPPPTTLKLANEQSLAFEERFRKEESFPEPDMLSPEKIWAPF